MGIHAYKASSSHGASAAHPAPASAGAVLLKAHGINLAGSLLLLIVSNAVAFAGCVIHRTAGDRIGRRDRTGLATGHEPAGSAGQAEPAADRFCGPGEATRPPCCWSDSSVERRRVRQALRPGSGGVMPGLFRAAKSDGGEGLANVACPVARLPCEQKREEEACFEAVQRPRADQATAKQVHFTTGKTVRPPEHLSRTCLNWRAG